MIISGVLIIRVVESLEDREKEELRLWSERTKNLDTPIYCCVTLSKLILYALFPHGHNGTITMAKYRVIAMILRYAI